MDVPITPSSPTSQPAAVAMRNCAPGRGSPVTLSRFCTIMAPFGWFLNVRETVRPSFTWTVWDWESRMNPAGAWVSVTTTLFPGFRPVTRISPFSSVRKTPFVSPMRVPSAYMILNSASWSVTLGLTEQTLRTRSIPSGALVKRTVTTLCSPLSARKMVSDSWMML